jgi:hypothetical protein
MHNLQYFLLQARDVASSERQSARAPAGRSVPICGRGDEESKGLTPSDKGDRITVGIGVEALVWTL